MNFPGFLAANSLASVYLLVADRLYSINLLSRMNNVQVESSQVKIWLYLSAHLYHIFQVHLLLPGPVLASLVLSSDHHIAH